MKLLLGEMHEQKVPENSRSAGLPGMKSPDESMASGRMGSREGRYRFARRCVHSAGLRA